MPPQRDEAFMPLGVYWAGEHTFPHDADRWEKIDAALDDMAAHHFNAVWLTHLSASDTAEFARRAAKRGIYLVASIANIAGDVPHIRNGNHEELIAGVMKDWGDAPQPIAWGLGDEPLTCYMGEMAAYAAAWHRYAPGEPVTTVVMHGDLAAAGTAGFDILTADIYPFFSGGNPNGYNMAPWDAWLGNLGKLRLATPRPWMMGQAYQEPWGPHEFDADGNIVYLPGGAPHWVMPSPDQMRWQTLSAVAAGAKGVFYFIYRWPAEASPNAEPAKLPAAAKERTNSHAPRALVHPNGRSTPQYEATGESFGWVARFMRTLAPLVPARAGEAWMTHPAPKNGSVVSMLVHPKTGKRYLMAVSTYAGEAPHAIEVTVGPHVIAMKSLTDGSDVEFASVPPFRTARITLPPARAELFECTVDATKLPSTYSDDFGTDRFEKDAIEIRNVARHGPGILSASGHQSHDQAFVVYDLERFMPALGENGMRMLMYRSSANPDTFRGAFWSVSDDGTVFKALSSNEPGKPVLFSGRYLKVGMSWTQSTVPSVYGCLHGFDVVQWSNASR